MSTFFRTTVRKIAEEYEGHAPLIDPTVLAKLKCKRCLVPKCQMTSQGWLAILLRMDVERIIDEIQQLEEMFEAADIRPLKEADVSAANRRHDEMLAHSPWFKLWQHYGICCRNETPVIQLPE